MPTKRYTVEVPRLPVPGRSTFSECLAYAKQIAAKDGVRGEPKAASYDRATSVAGGPMQNPQGWAFTWLVPAD